MPKGRTEPRWKPIFRKRGEKNCERAYNLAQQGLDTERIALTMFAQDYGRGVQSKTAGMVRAWKEYRESLV